MEETRFKNPHRPQGSVRPAKAVSDHLDEIRRVVYRHKWASLEDWVRSLDELADLDDDDIDEVARLTRGERDEIYFE